MRDDDIDIDDSISILIEKAKPYLGKITFGTIVGYCSGAAVRRIGKVITLIAGLTYIAIQTAVSYEYIHVDWERIKLDALSKVDSDGDKSFSAKDARIYWNKFKSTMTRNIPSAGGFSLGFMYGVAYD